MKSIFFKKYSWAINTFLGLLVFTMFFSSCKKDDKGDGPITITAVYLQDASSSVPDREVNFVRIGQLIRIEGSGFTGLKKVYINGYSTYFNPVLVSDNSMLVSISGETQLIGAPERDIIRFANDNYNVMYEIEVRAAAPTITNISNTMPKAGETITVYGTGLLEVNRVVFPGDVVVTSGIASNDEGEFFTVTVPDGVSEEGGSIMIECANGGAYSPAYFNFKKGVILDFDGNGQQGYWGSAASMITADDLESASIGIGNISQGTYVPHIPARLSPIAAGSTRCSEVWTAGNDVDNWRAQLTPYIPATTPVDQVAVQFDIYVPDEWSETGYLKVCLTNGFNGGEWSRDCYNYIPWLVDGEVVPFRTNGWTTVTIPFSMFYAFSDPDDGEVFTFENVLATRESSSYRNFGFYFENSDFSLDDITGNEDDSETEFPSAATSVNVYTDNWRVVSLNTPAYSDFTDK